MKIIWSPLALARVRQETAQIALDRPSAARTWAEGTFAAVELLADLPESGKVLPELGLPHIRQLRYRNHRIIYKIEGVSIRILTVRHVRRLLDLSEL
jgi:plasmid stabilization system protein ParE